MHRRIKAVPYRSIFFAAVTALMHSTISAQAVQKGDRFIPLEVNINGVNSGTWAILERGDVLYASQAAFSEWRLVSREKAQSIQVRGETYRALSSVPGFEWKINSATQTLDVQFAPTAFSTTRLTNDEAKRAPTSPALLGGFVTYDMNATRSQMSSLPNSNDLGAYIELGLTGSWGVLTSSYVGRNLLHSSQVGPEQGWRRLETTFTRDMPERNQTLRLGDAITTRGLWGREVYFAGLQWGSNFALSPGLNTRALPVVSGVSSAPSTVELYVNDALRQVSKVPAGPFTIDNFPLVTGAGDARIVIKDILGRETVLVQPFLTHQDLLATDHNEWSIEVGVPRRNLGLQSDDYGAAFAAGLWRRGLSTSTTMELKFETSLNTSALGFGGSVGLPGQHLASLAVVASRDARAGSGQQYVADITRISDDWTYSFRAQRSSVGFRSLGQNTASGQQYSATSNVRIGSVSNLGVALVSTQIPDQPRLTTFNLTHSQKIGQRSSLVTSLTKLYGAGINNNNAGWALGLTLLVPLDGGRNFSASSTSRPGASSTYVAATETLQGDTGASWRVLAGQRESQNYAEAGYYVQGSQGLLSADLQAAANQQTLRLGAQGGLVIAGGQVFATQRSLQSFALAEVKGYPGVGVMANGRAQGVTDASGIRLVAGLSPYQANAIRLNAQDLPISAELDNIETSVNPPWRSIVKADFPVRSGRAALIRITFEDGQPAPPAAVITLQNDPQVFYVARRGEAYVTGLESSNQLTLRWKEQMCQFSVELPPASRDEILRLGPTVCKGVQR
ncbi:MAG: fimbria/pilus outer membrane usher protein [Burkholderiaceae bacterium]|nr:fimbria/pilus outer membrane usher protein [Burkholderiaceae bacterium]